jgi:hypothetical protein
VPAGDPRLSDFLEWVAGNGLAPARVGDYRRIAVELLGVSGGQRVTESHILKLLDTYAESPTSRGATAMIEEVGEALLRFEAARKLQAAQSPEPRRSSQPFTVRPDERVAGDLRPPDSSRDTGPEQKVVSFAAQSSSAATTPVPRPRAAPEARRQTGSQFRCRRCQAMVTASEGGACPRCGTPAPRISSGQLPVAARSSSPSLGSWILPVVLGVAAFFLAFAFGPGLLERLRHPSDAAAGTTTSPHLGVRLTLPEGWRHSAGGDRAPTTEAGGLEAILPEQTGLRASRYFRGSARDPDAELVLAVAPRPSRVTDDVFAAWAERAARGRIQGPLQDLAGLPGLTLESCVTGAAIPARALRCAAREARTPAVVHVFAARALIAVAVYVDRAGAGDPTAAADEIVAGLDLGG